MSLPRGMTEEQAVAQLLDTRSGVPPVDDAPADLSAGETPAGPDDIDEEG